MSKNISSKNSNLSAAKKAKNDEFYTQYHDIEKEMNAYLDFNKDVFRGKTILLPCDDPEWSNFTLYFAQNFERLGLKKLISTSYAHQSKQLNTAYQPSLFESESKQYDSDKSHKHGKIYTLTEDSNHDGVIDFKDVKWQYLQGDGDFRSDEIKALCDESDIIITNPPFSLFREFMAWIMKGKKQFAVIGNMNAITYKEIFPLIKENKIWLGATGNGNDMVFAVPQGADVREADKKKAERLGYIGDYTRLGNSCWFTNIEHGRRYQPLQLMTMADNLKFNKQIINDPNAYQAYDNYDAIEVPRTNGIPGDYAGVMGVPISFLDKYCPEQFEIIWQASGNTRASTPEEILEILNYSQHSEDRGGCTVINGKRTYGRILIKHIKPQNK
ncbi:adenine-specific methyltransferase EcoRI family protein [Escherichia coli]|nr:adenine-specific methyltransferase EcoRI family protein [Escherichia coli]